MSDKKETVVEPKTLIFGSLKVTRTGRKVQESELSEVQKNGFSASIIAEGETITFPQDLEAEWAEMNIAGKVVPYQAFFTTDGRPVSVATFAAQMSEVPVLMANEALKAVLPNFQGLSRKALIEYLAGKSFRATLVPGFAQQFETEKNAEGKQPMIFWTNVQTGISMRKLAPKKFLKLQAV